MLMEAASLDLALAHNYTVVEEFDEPNGKFPALVGDVVLIDCSQAPKLISSTYRRIYERLLIS